MSTFIKQMREISTSAETYNNTKKSLHNMNIEDLEPLEKLDIYEDAKHPRSNMEKLIKNTIIEKSKFGLSKYTIDLKGIVPPKDSSIDNMMKDLCSKNRDLYGLQYYIHSCFTVTMEIYW